MRKILFFIALIFFTAESFAQLDKSKGSSSGGGISIPAVELPEPKPEEKPDSKESPKETPKKTVAFPQPEKEKKPISMRTDNGLLTYTLDNFTPKAFKKDKEAKEAFKEDQYLGDYMTKGGFVEIYCRDHEFVDGDKVRVYVNGVVAHHAVSLMGGYSPILVKLKSGFNTIEFEALNQGTSGPNTAELRLLDEQGQNLAQKEWNLLTGAKARLVVVKN